MDPEEDWQAKKAADDLVAGSMFGLGYLMGLQLRLQEIGRGDLAGELETAIRFMAWGLAPFNARAYDIAAKYGVHIEGGGPR